MKKILFLALSVVLCVSLLGCKKGTTLVDTIVWQNDTSHDLAVTIYTINGEWKFGLNSGESVVVCRYSYRTSGEIDYFQPIYKPPFCENWKCDKGTIDSVVFVNVATNEKLTTCSNAGNASYKPLAYDNCYESIAVADGERYTFHITPKRYAVMSKRCPCESTDVAIAVENLSGTIHFYNFYAVWYFKSDTQPSKLYMLENLSEQYRCEGLQASVTGIGKTVDLSEPWSNFFSGGCLSDYSIVEN